MQPELIIRRPIVLTEKSTRLREQGNKVIFEVHPDANKIEIKTKALVDALGALKADKKALVVDNAGNEKLVKSIRNLEHHQFLPPEGVNVYDLLRHDHLVVSKEAAKALEARCLR
jgi:ribosomal protein L4